MDNPLYVAAPARLLAACYRLGRKAGLAPSALLRYVHLSSLHDGINLATATQYLTAHGMQSADLTEAGMKADAAATGLQALRAEVARAQASFPLIPKIIWIYWNRGLDSAPEVVRLAYRSWQELNPDYEVRFLDDRSVLEYCDINQVFLNASLRHTVAHRSDFLRTYLLARFGGVWADSTAWCWQPLAQWLGNETAASGFFMFRQPESRQDRQITNWFIASSAGHPISVAMFEALSAYIFKQRDVVLGLRKPRHYAHYPDQSRTGTGYALLERLEREGYYPYFYYHYLFNEVVSQGEPARIWAQVIKSRNLHAKNQGPVDDAFVSKQTHKGDYQSTPAYQARKEQLLGMLARG